MSQCRSCGAEILWAVTEKGNRIPLDAEPAERPTGLFRLDYDNSPTPTAIAVKGEPVYLSHFATCPDAEQHRKT